MLTGRKWTDKELAKMERRLHKIYKQASEELTKKAEDYFLQFEIMDTRKWKAVLAHQMSEDDYFRWRKSAILTGEHWTRMKEQAAQDLYTVNQRALDYINGRIPNIYAMNYNFSAEDIQNGVSNRISFEMVDAQTVKNLSFEDKSLLPPKKHWDPKKDIPWNMKKINSECLQGILQGESMSDIAKRLLRVGVQNEVSAIRAARTIVNAAENKGRFDSASKAQENGVILGKRWITVHDSRTRDWHKKAGDDYGTAENSIPIDEPFIVGGEEMMYPGEVGASARNVYNCFIGETNVTTNSEIIRSYRHEYSGDLITVKTTCGVSFTCTPNHPILTSHGWIAAKFLQNGNDIIVTFRRNNIFNRIYPNINHTFSSIKAIHKFFYMMWGKRAIRMPVDFHGDISTSDVEIIAKKRFLRENRNSRIFNSIYKFFFKHSNKSFFGFGSFMKHFRRVVCSTFGLISITCETFAFLRCYLRHPEIHSLRPIALLYPGTIKPIDNNTSINSKLIGECLNGFTGIIFSDKIIDINVNSKTCHVYNLQTKNGYYFVDSSITQNNNKNNGIFAIAHNCRCGLSRVIYGFKSTLQKGTIKVSFK